jgi:iron complex outermembrane recepter protein
VRAYLRLGLWAALVLQLQPAAAAGGIDTQNDAAASEAEAETLLELIPVAPVVASELEIGAPLEVPRSRTRAIEEIVVTAQKREQNLQDVPISIQAFSGEALTDRGVSDTQALTRITPGLIYNSNAGYAMAYIRGIGSDTPLPTADPSVATYVDGIYFPMVQSTIQSFANLERIEVLKGPQGTLFGRNTTGGAISIVTRDPGPDREFRFEGELGNYDHWRASLYAAEPIGDSFAVGVSAFMDRTDAYYTQTNPDGPPVIDSRNWGARVKLAYFPQQVFGGRDLDIVLSGYILDHRGADTNVKNQFRPSLLATLLGAQATPEPYRSASDVPDSNVTRSEGADLRMTLGLGSADLVSITGYQNIENYGFVDYDATAASGVGFGAQPGLAESFSQELQLISTSWDRLDWVVGGYYFKGSGGFVPVNFGLTGVLPAALFPEQFADLIPLLLNPVPGGAIPSITIPNTPAFVAELLDAVGNLIPVEELALALGNAGLLNLPGNSIYVAVPLVSVVDTEAYAAFTQGTWRLADWINITAGLRYSNETRGLVRNEIYAPRVIADPGRADRLRGVEGSPLVARPPRERSWDDLSTKLVVEFPFTGLGFIDSGLAYVGRTEGFKSGTWNPVALTNAPEPVEPETVVSYEGGFKTDLFGGSMRINASAFLYEYDNLQLTSIALTSGGSVRLENAGRAQVEGVDFEVILAPLDGLQLALLGSVLRSEYEVCNCSGFQEDTGVGFAGDFAGNELVNAPRFTGTADLSYRLDAPGGELELAGTVYHNDGYWFDAQNSFRQNSYQLYGARLSYAHARSGLRLSVYGNNLTDELYFINGNVNDFGIFGTYGMPRSYGLRLQWQWQQ